MMRLKRNAAGELSFGRTLRLFALLLFAVAGVFWLLLLFAPALPSPELFAAVLLNVLCTSLAWYVWYTNSRSKSVPRLAEQPPAERIIEQVSEGILTINQCGEVVSLNPAAERLFGYRSEEVLNEPVTKLLKEPPNENQKLFHDTISVGTILGLAAGAREMIGKRKNGETFPIELVMSGMTFGDEQVTVAFARDVSKRKQAQRYLTAHYAATCILAEASSLEEALPQILQSFSEALRWEACAYWSFDPTTNKLRCDEVYQSPFAVQPNVLDAKALTCKLDQGLAGRVWSTGKSLWIEDLRRMEDFTCLTLAVPLQLHGAFAFPIITRGEVCGVLAMFSTCPLKRDPWLSDIMSEFGKQVGHFIARKRDEKKLMRSEERFRQLAENIHEVFWMMETRNDQIIYVSPSCEEVWGQNLTGSSQSSVKLVSKPPSFLDYVHPEDRPSVRASMERQKQGEKTSEEYRIVRPDGEVRWVWSRAFPILDATKEVYRIVGITADITDRKQAEAERGRLLEAVEHQRGELQMILDSVPALIFYKDRQHRFVRVNQAHVQCHGLPREQIEGKTDEELGSPYASQYMQDDLNVMATGEPLRGVIEEIQTPLGTRWLQTEKVPHRDAQGNIIGLVGLALDITEKKHLEEQLRQAQKMEAVGQLAGGIAHDFNNLLTVIIGYSEILLGQSKPGDQTYELQEQIQKAGERAASLTRQLLAFGRKQTFQVKILDINTVVQDMSKMLHRIIGEDIEMVIQQDPLLGRVKADPSQVEQILMNLASNARDAMPHGGRLTITTSNADVDLERSPSCLDSEVAPAPYVMLTVSDTGNGMNETTKAHAFEPFFTTKEVGKGTGLGLATVYGIIKQSAGHIEVDSEVGQGTTFRIYLPRLKAAGLSVHDQQSLSGILPGKETVLLVEDEEAVRQMVCQALQSNGYTVLSASSGEQALALCQQHVGEIALLLTDVIMPRMNGVQLAELAATVRENLKVLYISGYTNSIVESHGTSLSSAAFLSKPVTPRALVKKVREVLDAHPCKTAC